MEKRKLMIPISSSRALKIALEDSETSYFIKANFSYPEKNPKILSQKWISKDGRGYKWNVEIVEKPELFLNSKKEIFNIALIEVDLKSGRIIKRHYLKYILASEYRKFLKRK